MDPDKFRHDRSDYERPFFPFRCGRAAIWGKPCPHGPRADGSCGGTAECEPRLTNGEYACNRRRIAGGPCAEGPLPDGACSQTQPPCVPRRTLPVLRRRLVLVASGLLAAAVVAFFDFERSIVSIPSSIDPGPLSGFHDKFTGATGCATCHAAHGKSLKQWFFAAFSESDPSGQCVDCHVFGGDPTRPHDAAFKATRGREVTRCTMCHTEHDGADDALIRISDSQCHTCHKVPFTSFSTDHPPYRLWFPAARRTAIKFSHANHYKEDAFKKRFNRDAKAGDMPQGCPDCHQVATAGAEVRPGGFEFTCAQCHEKDIRDGDLVLIRRPDLSDSKQLPPDLAEACGIKPKDLPEPPEGAPEPDPVSAYLLGEDGNIKDLIVGLAYDGPGPLADLLFDRLEALSADAAEPAAVEDQDVPEGSATDEEVQLAESRDEPVLPEAALEAEGKTEVKDTKKPRAKKKARAKNRKKKTSKLKRQVKAGTTTKTTSEKSTNKTIAVEDADQDEQKAAAAATKDEDEAPEAAEDVDADKDEEKSAEDVDADKDEAPEAAEDLDADKDEAQEVDADPDEETEADADEETEADADKETEADADKETEADADQDAETPATAQEDANEAPDESDSEAAQEEPQERQADDTAAPAAAPTAAADTPPRADEPPKTEDRLKLLLSGLGAPTVRRAVCSWYGAGDADALGDGSLGGWFADDSAIRYRATSHSDAVARAWLEFALLAKATDVENPRATAFWDYMQWKKLDKGRVAGVGSCTRCHAVSQAADPAGRLTTQQGGLMIEWMRDSSPKRRFTVFNHRPHLTLMGSKTLCASCHRLSTGQGFEATYAGYDRGTFVSSFSPIVIKQCTECHTEGKIREDCQLCHRYHQAPALKKEMYGSAERVGAPRRLGSTTAGQDR